MILSARGNFSITACVGRHASMSPSAPALRAGTAFLDYAALYSQASRLAGYLQSIGLRPGMVVGVGLDRSIQQITTILAVLSAGAAFLPLDLAWPDAHLKQVLDDADAPFVIGMGDRLMMAAGGRVLVLLDRDEAAVAASAHGLAIDVSDDDLAYVIYTSGSTGEPKGVEITHGNLRNLVEWHLNAFQITTSDHASHVAGLGFDAAVWEVLPHLAAGACVSLVPEECRYSWRALQAWLIEQKITVAFVPTVLAAPLLDAPWPVSTPLRLLLTGGEALTAWPRPDLPFAVVNNYGPTECTVVASSGTVGQPSNDGDMPAIGWPIDHVRLAILDSAGNPVEPGAVGEIYIEGRSVGRGYRNRPDLTAQCFDRNAKTGERRFRTGDLGRRLPDGQIGFCGRLDAQEKIRGHRIEPGAIELALNRHPSVRVSVVVGRDTARGERELVAYIVAADGVSPTEPGLREYLGTQLPDYMIPASFVSMAELPLTSSGKVDRQALPPPALWNALETTPYRSPQTPAEQRVADIFARLLGVSCVGVDHNFFNLGGHSLLAAQTVHAAREAFGVELTLLHLFQTQTAAKLARLVEQLLVTKLDAMSDEDAQVLLAG